MKFGGTSIKDGAAIHNVCRIVARRLDSGPVVVVSAHAGVTDALEELARDAVRSSGDPGAIRRRHESVLEELGLGPGVHGGLFEELSDLCRGISLVGELSQRSRDYVLSFGERLAARTVAAAFRAEGIRASAADACDIGLRTTRRSGRAQLLEDDARIQAALKACEGVPVITGFIARDENGNITTLGRNGSDLSAAFIGNALDAEEIQIWTDVDGVLTADPRVVPNARPIPRMCYDEAAELANHGGRILHPSALHPAIQKEIPVRVLNTERPESEGTLVLASFEEPGVAVRCIAHKRHVTLVNVQTSRMLAQPGFLARIFRVFEGSGISVDMVATSEVSVSITLDNEERLDEAVRSLREFSQVDIHKDLGLICVVGHGIAHRLGVPARVFRPLEEAGVEVRMISLGAQKVNVSLLVDGSRVEAAVRALHEEFFGS
ncbi:MAG: aspartate kinase [Planctomycetota bacterium]